MSIQGTMYRKADASLTRRLGGPLFPVGTDAASAALTGVTAWNTKATRLMGDEIMLQSKIKLASFSSYDDKCST